MIMTQKAESFNVLFGEWGADTDRERERERREREREREEREGYEMKEKGIFINVFEDVTGSGRSVTVTVVESALQFLNEAAYDSLHTNAPAKGLNPLDLWWIHAYGKIFGQTGFPNFD